MGIPDHPHCLLRILYAGQEATVRSRHGTTDWFQIGKGVCQGYCHLVYLTYMHSTPCEMSGWMKHKLESRLQREISITSDMQITSPLWKKVEELKSLLMKVKEESEKAVLKFNIQKMKIMTSSPITSWQLDVERMETVTDFIFLGSKITADGDHSHEIKRHLLLGRRAMTNLDSILKSRDITLPPKVHLVKAMVFPVVMYGCESWTIKKAERRRIDAFELRCQRRFLRVPWTSRRSNQSILNELNPEYSLGGLMLKLKFQYLATWCEELTQWKRPWSWERLKTRGEGDDRAWGGWMASLTQWTWVWQALGDGEEWGSLACCGLSTQQLNDSSLNNCWTISAATEQQ